MRIDNGVVASSGMIVASWCSLPVVFYFALTVKQRGASKGWPNQTRLCYLYHMLNYVYTKVRCIEPQVADFLIGVWIILIHWPYRTTERTRSKCYWDLGFSSWDLENSHLESKTLLRGCSDISKRWSSEGASTPSLDSWVPKWETAIQRKDRDMLRPIRCVHSWSMSEFGQIWTSARSTRCIWDWRGFFIG